MNHKELFQKVNEVSYLYSFYLEYLNGQNNYSLASDEGDERSEAIKYVGAVYKSFMHLPQDEKEVISNEFFAREKSDWWKKKYTEKQFSSLLFLGMKRFMFYFDNQYEN